MSRDSASRATPKGSTHDVLARIRDAVLEEISPDTEIKDDGYLMVPLGAETLRMILEGDPLGMEEAARMLEEAVAAVREPVDEYERGWKNALMHMAGVLRRTARVPQ